MMNPAANPLLLVVLLSALVPVAIVALFAVILATISRLGGWHQLAENYPAQTMPRGRQFGMQSVQLRRWAGYNNCVHFAADESGLWLWCMWPFTFQHPQLYFPWSEISLSNLRVLGIIPVTQIQLRQVPSVPLRISQKLAQRLQSAAGKSWPAYPQAEEN
jgi:hypothetical protein